METVAEHAGNTSPAATTPYDLAAVSAFLEIGDRLGILPFLDGSPVTSHEVAAAVGLPVDAVSEYLAALCHAGLVERAASKPDAYHAVDELAQLRYEAGYVSWAMNANRPFINHAPEFLRNAPTARGRYARDGRQVAVSSQWMGSRAFYPEALEVILAARPRHFVDLGAGSGRLLIEVLSAIPGATGVALDLDGNACAAARDAAIRAGMAERLRVCERSIQSVADDAEVLRGAEAIHAGFVFHDMMPDEESTADRVLARCRERMLPGGILAITEAVPYVENSRERKFSALVTYYHNRFMGRRLLTEAEWQRKLRSAGFQDVEARRLVFPTGRLFVATT